MTALKIQYIEGLLQKKWKETSIKFGLGLIKYRQLDGDFSEQ